MVRKLSSTIYRILVISQHLGNLALGSKSLESLNNVALLRYHPLFEACELAVVPNITPPRTCHYGKRPDTLSIGKRNLSKKRPINATSRDVRTSVVTNSGKNQGRNFSFTLLGAPRSMRAFLYCPFTTLFRVATLHIYWAYFWYACYQKALLMLFSVGLIWQIPVDNEVRLFNYYIGTPIWVATRWSLSDPFGSMSL